MIIIFSILPMIFLAFKRLVKCFVYFIVVDTKLFFSIRPDRLTSFLHQDLPIYS
jgi:hypothetical protein